LGLFVGAVLGLELAAIWAVSAANKARQLGTPRWSIIATAVVGNVLIAVPIVCLADGAA
jgi:hypothetical protein